MGPTQDFDHRTIPGRIQVHTPFTLEWLPDRQPSMYDYKNNLRLTHDPGSALADTLVELLGQQTGVIFFFLHWVPTQVNLGFFLHVKGV